MDHTSGDAKLDPISDLMLALRRMLFGMVISVSGLRMTVMIDGIG
jgi:hypothetical protein